MSLSKGELEAQYAASTGPALSQPGQSTVKPAAYKQATVRVPVDLYARVREIAYQEELPVAVCMVALMEAGVENRGGVIGEEGEEKTRERALERARARQRRGGKRGSPLPEFPAWQAEDRGVDRG